MGNTHEQNKDHFIPISRPIIKTQIVKTYFLQIVEIWPMVANFLVGNCPIGKDIILQLTVRNRQDPGLIIKKYGFRFGLPHKHKSYKVLIIFHVF